MSGWIVVAFFLGEGAVYLWAMQRIARNWLSDRWSAARSAVAAGILTALLVGLPIFLSGMRERADWLVGLLVIVVVAGIVISRSLTLWTYAERHGVKDQLRRQFARKHRPR